jgi:hypothetical protein
MSMDKLLSNSIIITLIIVLIDYMIISDHTGLLENENNKRHSKHKKEHFDDTFSDEDIDEIINAYDMETENIHTDNEEYY